MHALGVYACARQMLARLRTSISSENMRKLEGTRDMLGAHKASRMIRQYEDVLTERAAERLLRVARRVLHATCCTALCRQVRAT
jgi:hypothetical protein